MAEHAQGEDGGTWLDMGDAAFALNLPRRKLERAVLKGTLPGRIVRGGLQIFVRDGLPASRRDMSRRGADPPELPAGEYSAREYDTRRPNRPLVLVEDATDVVSAQAKVLIAEVR